MCTVDEPTLILPSNVIKLEHTSFNLTCTILIDLNSPDHSPVLTWHDSEGNILASSNGTQANHVVLLFTNAQRAMSGVYKCNAHYDNTLRYSGTTHLYIQCKSNCISYTYHIISHNPKAGPNTSVNI